MYAGTQRAAVRPSTVSQYDILNYFIYSWVIQSIGSQSVGRAPAESHKINLRGSGDDEHTNTLIILDYLTVLGGEMSLWWIC